MEVEQRIKIPPDIWRRCDKELRMYKLRKARVTDARALVFVEGGKTWPSLAKGHTLEANEHDEFLPGGGGSIYKSTLDAQLERLTRENVEHDEQIVKAVEEVVASLRGSHRHFFQLYYENGLTVVECAEHMSYTRKQISRYKHEIIERTAFRLWFI